MASLLFYYSHLKNIESGVPKTPSILSTQNPLIESCQKTNANGIKYETDLYYPNSPSYNFRTIPFESQHYKYGQSKFWLDPLYQLRGNSNEIHQVFFSF